MNVVGSNPGTVGACSLIPAPWRGVDRHHLGSEVSPVIPPLRRPSSTHQSWTHRVFRAGTGPAVVVVHEIPSLHPGSVEFGQRLVDAGFTVYLPPLFGRPGKPLTIGATVRAVARVCVAREFTVLADRTSPVAHWLRARHPRARRVRRSRRRCGRHVLHRRLAMAVEPSVLAPILSQPALPAPLTARKRAALGLNADDLTRIQDRGRPQHGLCVLGLRFSHDKGSPAQRFDTL
jgi:hypothetical protein